MNLRLAFVFFIFNLLFWLGSDLVEALEPAGLPGTIQAQDYDAASGETDGRKGARTGICAEGQVDMQVTDDNNGGCYVGWTRPGEWLEFKTEVNSDANFDLVLRLASARENKTVTVELDGKPIDKLTAPSEGWKEFQDLVIENVAFSTGEHTLRVSFDTGAVNLNYIEVNEASSPAFINSFGAFNFDFPRLATRPQDQFSELKEIGYAGLTMNVRKQEQRDLLTRYTEIKADTDLEIYAGFMIVRFDQNNSKFFRELDDLLERLKAADAAFWFILGTNNLSRAENLELIEQVADMAREKSVEFILYPHAGTEIETAEQALGYIEALDRRDIYLSIHLTHEIRAGNGERLGEIAEKVQQYLRLPSISGSDLDYQNDVGSKKTIQPLYKGSYKPIKLLRALKSINYRGPIILHTFGLTTDERAPADHHHRSFDHYLELQKQLQ